MCGRVKSKRQKLKKCKSLVSGCSPIQWLYDAEICIQIPNQMDFFYLFCAKFFNVLCLTGIMSNEEIACNICVANVALAQNKCEMKFLH